MKKYPPMGISPSGSFGRNGNMKPFALVCALGILAGCGRPVHHYPAAGDAVVPKEVVHTNAAPDIVTPPRYGIVDPPPPPPLPVDRGHLPLRGIDSFAGALHDAWFPYDRAEPLPESLATLEQDARVLCAMLQEFPGAVIIVEGHCDDRGSAEYNIGLGDRRARTAARILIEKGVPPASLDIVSFGKEMPQCLEPTESCRARNRRAHLTVRPAPSPETAAAPASDTPPPTRHPLP